MLVLPAEAADPEIGTGVGTRSHALQDRNVDDGSLHVARLVALDAEECAVGNGFDEAVTGDVE